MDCTGMQIEKENYLITSNHMNDQRLLVSQIATLMKSIDTSTDRKQAMRMIRQVQRLRDQLTSESR